jgi:formyl-CoA transferase
MGVGPFSGALLGALGADVVKVEAPEGDFQYRLSPSIDGVSTLYLNFNTDKRGVHIDMKSDDGREAMWRLIERSDVMVNNFRLGVAERLGFGYPEVRERNPGIVYVQASGFGEQGPMSRATGGDHWIQVFSGWCSLMGEEGGAYELLRFLGHLDLNTSFYIVGAVLTGLHARDAQGGFGMHVGMTEAALSMQSTRLAEYLIGDVVPAPLGSASPVVAPSQAFRTSDGAWVAVCAETEGQWARLCSALGREDMAAEYPTNVERVTRRHELVEELQRELELRPAAWWVMHLARHRVPCSKFWDFDLIKSHPQVVENEHLVRLDTGRCGIVDTGGAPWKFSATPVTIGPPSYSGAETAEILTELEEPASAGGPQDVPAAVTEPSLSGLRVVELSVGIAGPYCGSLFADGGAEVTKVEPPGGDYLRGWGPPLVDGTGVAFLHLNRRKRLLTLAVDDPELRRTVSDADVVILDAVDPDGNPPPEWISAANPSAIVVSVSAYGEKGPMAALPGSELTVQAMTESCAGLGSITDPPRRVGADQASMNAGLNGYQGALAALLHRRKTGEGQTVSVSLLGAMHSIRGLFWASVSNPDDWVGQNEAYTQPPAHGTRTATSAVLATLNLRLRQQADPEQAAAIARDLGSELPADLDPVDAGPLAPPTHPANVYWQSLFERVPADELAKIVGAHGGQVVPMTDYATLDAHPQTAAMAPFRDEQIAGRRVRTVKVPWRLLLSALPEPEGSDAAKPPVGHAL